MTDDEQRDRYIEAILGGRLRFHLHVVVGTLFAVDDEYAYWRTVHRRWQRLYYWWF